LLLLILGAIVYAGTSFVLLPLYDSLKQGSSAVTDKEQQLSKYRRAMGRKGHYTELLDQVGKNIKTDETRFNRGDNPTLAAVELQTIVEGAAQKNGLTLNQRNISPARKKDDFFNEIAMTVSFEASPAEIARFLTDIRNSPKFVSARTVQFVPTE